MLTAKAVSQRTSKSAEQTYLTQENAPKRAFSERLGIESGGIMELVKCTGEKKYAENIFGRR